MNRDHPKPKYEAPVTPAPAAPQLETVSNNLTGRVKHDDRGNAIWEWAMASGKFGSDGASQRIKKLDVTNLSLQEDAHPNIDSIAQTSVKPNPLGTVKGYSPYDSGLLEKKAANRKKDLRKLSEWLKLKKQAETNKSDDE